MNRPTIMKTTAFRQHLADGKRFYEGYIYQTNRKTYMVYTPEHRCWIDKNGKCWTYALSPRPVSHQNPWGNSVTPTAVKAPPNALKLRSRIMRDINLKDLPSDRAKPGPRSKQNGQAPQEPKEVIESIHQAAQRAGKGPTVLEMPEWPADAPQPAVEIPERAPADGYENTQDYDVLRLLTDLWSRCGGSQEDLKWARDQFTKIGFLLPEVETTLTIVRSSNVTMDELVADLEGLGYKVRA